MLLLAGLCVSYCWCGYRGTGYDLSPRFPLFAEIQNLLDHRYYTYGAFAELDGLPPKFNLNLQPGARLFLGIAS